MPLRPCLALALLLALAACGNEGAPPPARPARAAAAAPAGPPVRVPAEIAAFYRERGNRPVWIGRHGPRPEALRLAAEIARAADHGLDPERYGAAELAAALDSCCRAPIPPSSATCASPPTAAAQSPGSTASWRRIRPPRASCSKPPPPPPISAATSPKPWR
jgi:hypothetical protein